MNLPPAAGKILYGALFIIVVPVALYQWASLTNDAIRWPRIQSTSGGLVLSLAGAALLVWAIYYLWTYGKGLPMNAYPPKRFVTEGPYQLFHHPVYVGFGVLVIGVSILSGSKSGLWLVSPLTILGMAALVWGYEKQNTERHFENVRYHTYFDLPKGASYPWRAEKHAVVIGVALAILVKNASLAAIYPRVYDMKPTHLFDNALLASITIVALWLTVIITANVLPSKNQLRQWGIAIIAACAIAGFSALAWPSLAAYIIPWPSGTAGLFGRLLSVPLFVWLISAWEIRNIRIATKSLLLSWFLLSLCLVLLNGSLGYLLASSVISFMAINMKNSWNMIRLAAEHLANSWQSWMIGPLRVINFGFYVGAGGLGGTLFIGKLIGAAYAWAVFLFAIIVIVCSALWAQFIEGSDKLKRPFGYYGALAGILFASLAITALGYNAWVVMGAFSTVMPWVQAVGRLRCLVNGCCHGSVTTNKLIGIRYFNEHSRVCTISHLKGKLLHPTPVYSFLWLFLVGIILIALWQHGASYSFIFGMYLILTGMGRFVEEAYRGEVQTPYLGNLRLYQWTAIISVALGMIFTTLNVPRIPLQASWGWEVPATAILLTLITTFAMGIDFPKATIRFSRLA